MRRLRNIIGCAIIAVLLAACGIFLVLAAEAPSVLTIKRDCDFVAAAVKGERAFIEVLAPESADKSPASEPRPRIQHLLIGDIRGGGYTHLVFGERPRAFQVDGNSGREIAIGAIAYDGGSLVLSRWGRAARLYADGKPLCDVAVGDGDIEVGCAWKRGAGDWRIRVQPVAELEYKDDFMREQFAHEDGWTAEAGRWAISQQAEAESSPNAFMLQAASEEGRPTLALTGYRFWNDYELAVSFNLAPGGALGLVFAENGSGDCYRASVRDGGGQGVVELARVEQGKETILAGKEVCLNPNGWNRMSVTVGEREQGRVSLDGCVLFTHDFARATFGRVGLYAAGRAGRFDDFSVMALRSAPAPETHAVVAVSAVFNKKPPYDRDDRDKWLHRWASDAEAWEQASLERGDGTLAGVINSTLLFNDFSIDLNKFKRACDTFVVVLHGFDRANLFVMEVGPDDAGGILRRAGNRLVWNDREVGALSAGQGARVGVYAARRIPPRLRPRIESACARAEFFETAPDRWQPAGGVWQPTNRWTCEQKWNFFGGCGADDVILFSKDRYDGGQCFEFFYAMKDVLANKRKRRYIRRDVCFSFCANGRDLASGYTVMYGGYGNRASYLLKGDVVVARNDRIRFSDYGDPEFFDKELHTKWWKFRIEKIGARIRVTRENELLFDWTDPDPAAPTGGHIAFWTWRNGVLYARVNSSAESVSNDCGQYLECGGVGKIGGWSALNPWHVRLESGASGRVVARNLFGGGAFAVSYDLPAPVDLTRTPIIRIPFAAPKDARVSLHVVVGGKGMIFPINGPTAEVYRVIGVGAENMTSWDAFIGWPLRRPMISDKSCLDRKRGCIELNLLDELKSRYPYLRLPPLLSSIAIGNTSNEGYLQLGFGGNASGSAYEVGRVEFMAADAAAPGTDANGVARK